MSDKVKGFGRRAAENLIAEAKVFGSVSCSSCGFSIKVESMTDVCRAFNFFQPDHLHTKSTGGNFARENHASICGTRLDSDYRIVSGCNQKRGNIDANDFYTVEQLARIKKIQSTEVTEAEWREFKQAYHVFNPDTDFTKRFPLNKQ